MHEHDDLSPVARDSAVMALAHPILRYLDQDGLSELVINEPGKLLLETDHGWLSVDAPELNISMLRTLATAIATYNNQSISAERPILSAMLPGGERVQIVQEPAVPPGTISFTIRRPSHTVRSMAQYVADGLFDGFVDAKKAHERNQADVELDALREAAKTDQSAMARFFGLAIEQHRNIAIVGDTGSGKTTFMKALCALLPTRERVITIEDVRELYMNQHPNRVHLLYSKGGQGVAKVTPADLIASCMRMKPDRVLLAELRGAESYDFLKLLTTGHSGSITSYHAASCSEAIARFVLMAKEHPEAAAYQDIALKRLFFTAMDIVAHVQAVPVFDDTGRQIGRRRVMTELYFDPAKKAALAYES